MSNKETLHLFLYHKDDDVTRQNYNKLCKTEGNNNVQPISECQSYLPNTFRLDQHPWPFPHKDSYFMCDALIYKYILLNQDKVMSYAQIVINEWDTLWQIDSISWLPKLMDQFEIAGSDLLVFGKHNWEWFDNNKKLSFASKMRGLVPFTLICIKSKLAVLISEVVRDDNRFHEILNCELRIGTVANMLGAKMGELPPHIKNNVKFRGTKYSSASGVYHPVKEIIPKNIIEKATHYPTYPVTEPKVIKKSPIIVKNSQNSPATPGRSVLNIRTVKTSKQTVKYNNVTRRK